MQIAKDQMYRLSILLAFALAGCVTPAANGQAPSERTIAQIESGFLLLQIVSEVGVIETSAMNEASRVKIRNATCTADEYGAANCHYEASRCLVKETDGDKDGWCLRQARFVRIDRPDDPFHVAMIADGWTIDRPQSQ